MLNDFQVVALVLALDEAIDAIGQWISRNSRDFWLAVVTFSCVALYYVIATSGRKDNG